MLTEAMKERRSVRTFDGVNLTEEEIKDLQQYADTIENPYKIPVTFAWLDAKEHGLSSPVLSGDTFYVTAKVAKVPYAEEALGYSFEKLMLYAVSKGFGTVWIGGTMKRAVFEQASGLADGEMMPCVTPVGRPAKMGVKEVLMRKGVGADKRKPASELFFEGSFEGTLKGDDTSVENALAAGAGTAEALEALRWAPSAVNKQPWRVVKSGNTYHIYEKQDKGYVTDAAGDLQKIDVGIGIAHFIITLEEAGTSYSYEVKDPGIAVPNGVQYIASVTV